MHKDNEKLREGIQYCLDKSDADTTKEHERYKQLAEWLQELYNRRGGPWCPGCGSPVVEEGDECHSCRDDSHDPDDKQWLSKYQ